MSGVTFHYKTDKFKLNCFAMLQKLEKQFS